MSWQLITHQVFDRENEIMDVLNSGKALEPNLSQLQQKVDIGKLNFGSWDFFNMNPLESPSLRQPAQKVTELSKKATPPLGEE